MHSPRRPQRRASPPGLVGTSLEPPGEPTSPSRWSPKLFLKTRPASEGHQPRQRQQQGEQEEEEGRRAMEQTLVRIYQREFCPGFPPQFAWPRLDGGKEGDEPSTSNRRRRPRARGQQQAEQQRVYAEAAHKTYAETRAAAAYNARRMQEGEATSAAFTTTSTHAFTEPAAAPAAMPSVPAPLECYHAARPQQGRRRHQPAALPESFDDALADPCRALERERAAAKRREEAAVWAAHRARQEEWRQLYPKGRPRPEAGGFWVDLSTGPPAVEEEEEVEEAGRSVRWEDEQEHREEQERRLPDPAVVAEPPPQQQQQQQQQQEEEQEEDEGFATARCSGSLPLDASGASGLGVSLHGSMIGAVEMHTLRGSAEQPAPQHRVSLDSSAGGLGVSMHGSTIGAVEAKPPQPPSGPQAQAANYRHPRTSLDSSVGGLGVSMHGSMVGAVEMQTVRGDQPYSPLSSSTSSSSLSSPYSLSPSPPGSPNEQEKEEASAVAASRRPSSPGMIDAEEEEGEDEREQGKRPLPSTAAVATARPTTAEPPASAPAFKPRPVPAPQPQHRPTAFWVGGEPSPTAQNAAAAASPTITSSPPPSVLARRAALEATKRERVQQRQHEQQQAKGTTTSLSSPSTSTSSFLLARSPTAALLHRHKHKLQPQPDNTKTTNTSSLHLAAKGGRWRVRIGADGSLELEDVGPTSAPASPASGSASSPARTSQAAAAAAGSTVRTTTTTSTGRFEDKGALMRGVGLPPSAAGLRRQGSAGGHRSNISSSPWPFVARPSASSPQQQQQQHAPPLSPSLFAATRDRSAFFGASTTTSCSSSKKGGHNQTLWHTAAGSSSPEAAAVIAGAATRPGADPLELALVEGIINEMADGIAVGEEALGKRPVSEPEAKHLISVSLRGRRQRRAALDARLATIDASIQSLLRDLRALSTPKTRALVEEFGY